MLHTGLSRGLLAATTLALIVATAGCAVAYDADEPGQTSASAGVDGATDDTTVAEPDGPDASDGADGAEPADGADATDADADADDADEAPEDVPLGELRSTYEGLVTSTLTCDGMLDVSAVGGIVAVTGQCDHLLISASSTIVLADTVGKLEVTGVGTTVVAGSADAVEVIGTSNVVVWESGSPSVSDTGIGNMVKPVE